MFNLTTRRQEGLKRTTSSWLNYNRFQVLLIVTKGMLKLVDCNYMEYLYTYTLRPRLTLFQFHAVLKNAFKKLEPKAFLLIDNTPSYLTHLSDLTTCIPAEVVFFPAYTISLIEWKDQGVILNFKTYYLRWTYRQLIDKIDWENIQEFLKNYNSKDAVHNMNVFWNEVTNMWKEYERMYSWS